MAASLPWRRDEEPAQLPRLAPHSGGVGPKDHARGFYLRSHRIRPISTINAIRAFFFVGRRLRRRLTRLPRFRRTQTFRSEQSVGTIGLTPRRRKQFWSNRSGQPVFRSL